MHFSKVNFTQILNVAHSKTNDRLLSARAGHKKRERKKQKNKQPRLMNLILMFLIGFHIISSMILISYRQYVRIILHLHQQ